MRLSKLGAVAAVSGLFAMMAASGPALAGNSANAKLCQKGGWQSAQTSSGGTFASQDECVAFGAQGGEVFKPMLVAVPDEVVEGQNIVVTASGFHPSDSVSVEIALVGGGSGTLSGVTDATGGLTFSDVFTEDACEDGISGAQFTVTDSFGVHASTSVTLICP